MKVNLQNPSQRFLLMLLSIDAAFILFHVLQYSTELISSYLFSIEQNKGYAEIFQATKEVWIVMLLCLMALKRRKPVYWVWMIVFGVLLLDDVMIFHKNISANLSSYLFAAHALRKYREKLGEMVVYLAVALPLFAIVRVAHRRSISVERQFSQKLLRLFSILLVFVVVVDIADVLIRQILGTGPVLFIMETIEEGGEMVMISLICGYIFGVNDL